MCVIKVEAVVLKTKEKLPEDIGTAQSIGAYNQPKDLVYIGSEKTEHDIFHYFKDNNGDYYYESERTMKFDEEMKTLQKIRRKKRKGKHGQKISH